MVKNAKNWPLCVRSDRRFAPSPDMTLRRSCVVGCSLISNLLTLRRKAILRHGSLVPQEMRFVVVSFINWGVSGFACAILDIPKRSPVIIIFWLVNRTHQDDSDLVKKDSTNCVLEWPVYDTRRTRDWGTILVISKLMFIYCCISGGLVGEGIFFLVNKFFVGERPSRSQTGKEPSPFCDTLINRTVLKTPFSIHLV